MNFSVITPNRFSNRRPTYKFTPCIEVGVLHADFMFKFLGRSRFKQSLLKAFRLKNHTTTPCVGRLFDDVNTSCIKADARMIVSVLVNGVQRPVIVWLIFVDNGSTVRIDNKAVFAKIGGVTEKL